ncbi:MAG: hypothetical protein GF317_04155 [Candidatus Lokiarchaeota archaeon]|nr:hypothetical protein [Candidatus Lokiarchaeota archaeon]MBD3199080.1 hypothetical protein [Candidatus Lokiarchaeota archaeon]
MNEKEGMPFSEESLRKIAEQKVKYRLSVKVHLGIYFFINAFLFIINIMTLPAYIWAFFPALGWFIGLSLHITAYLLYAKGVFPMAKRAFIFHLVAYIFVMALLISINANIMALTLAALNWIYFPLVSWGAALLVHGIIYKTYFSVNLTEEGTLKRKKEKAVEKEMQKLKKKMKEQY